MDLEFSEEQQLLRDLTRRVCEEYSPLGVVRKMEDDPIGYPTDLWKQLGELDLLGLLLPERYGGTGHSVLEGAIVYEELGRALCPSPHFVSSVLSGGVILRNGTEAQKDEWLPRIVSGEALLTPAWLEPDGSFAARGVQLRAIPDGNGFRLEGAKRHVQFASSAGRLVVLARTGDATTDVDLFLVDPQAKGVELRQQLSLASDSQYRVDFRGVRVGESDRVGSAGSGWAAWDATMQDGIILLGAQAIGGAQRALDLSVEYAKERYQFDKALGAFQAIAHYLADAATEVAGGQTLVYEAAWACAEGKPIDRLAPMAKLFACDVFRRLTQMAQQVFGGIGFTIEVDIQLFFRRAKQLELSYWDTRTLEERVASAVLD